MGGGAAGTPVKGMSELGRPGDAGCLGLGAAADGLAGALGYGAGTGPTGGDSAFEIYGITHVR